jgi:hypothetical protein
MTDQLPENAPAPEVDAETAGHAPVSTETPAFDPSRPPRASQGETPLYRGEPLDAERGPGLGCFWTQVILLGILLILTPVTVALAWPPIVSAALLILTLLLLLFTGQTVIFLLRLVAADRRGRRAPRSPSARKTVGMLEDESATVLSLTELPDPAEPAAPGPSAEAPAEGSDPTR